MAHVSFEPINQIKFRVKRVAERELMFLCGRFLPMPLFSQYISGLEAWHFPSFGHPQAATAPYIGHDLDHGGSQLSMESNTHSSGVPGLRSTLIPRSRSRTATIVCIAEHEDRT